MRCLLCALIGALFLLAGGAGCDSTNRKPEVHLPTKLLELPGDPVPAGSGGPKKAKPAEEEPPKKDREDPK